MNPSTEELLYAVDLVNANEIVLLPDNRNVVPVAREVARLHVAPMEVVETANVPEAIVAMLSFDAAKSAAANAGAMRIALGGVRTGQVTRAVRDARSDAGAVTRGDYLAIAAGGIVAIGDELERVSLELVEHLVGERDEVVTLYRGAGVDSAVAEQIAASIGGSFPDLVVEQFAGVNRTRSSWWPLSSAPSTRPARQVRRRRGVGVSRRLRSSRSPNSRASVRPAHARSPRWGSRASST